VVPPQGTSGCKRDGSGCRWFMAPGDGPGSSVSGGSGVAMWRARAINRGSVVPWIYTGSLCGVLCGDVSCEQLSTPPWDVDGA